MGRSVNGLLSVLCAGLFGSQAVMAQANRENALPYPVEIRNQDGYFEKVIYSDKAKSHFTVNTYLKDSTLYSIETYKYVRPQGETGADERVALRHGMTKFLYPDGRPYVIRNYEKNLLSGPLLVHYPTGALKRKEFYRRGHLIKGECYDSVGTAITCQPFFQPPTPSVSLNQLRAYLDERLMPIFDRNKLAGLVYLEISRTGEITDISYQLYDETALITSQIREVILTMPRWHEQEPNWNPARVDGVPMTALWIIHVYRDRGKPRLVLPVPD